MAKRGRKPKIQKKQANNLSVLVKKPEMWVGIFTIGILLGIVGGIVLKNQSSRPGQKEKAAFIAPSPEASPSASIAKIIDTPAVKRLAQTSSSLEVVVVANDSYWKIAQRACGNAKNNFLTIQDLNGNIKLYKGMVVKVVCE